MPTVSIPRARLRDGSLPSVCIVCGRPATANCFSNVTGPSMAWVFLSPLIGIMIFWIIVFAARFKKTPPPAGGVPFCERHHRYWPRRATIICGGFVYLILIIGLAILIGTTGVGPEWIVGVAGCSFPLLLIGFLITHFSATRCVGSDADTVTIAGASEAFEKALRRPAVVPQ